MSRNKVRFQNSMYARTWETGSNKYAWFLKRKKKIDAPYIGFHDEKNSNIWVGEYMWGLKNNFAVIKRINFWFMSTLVRIFRWKQCILTLRMEKKDSKKRSSTFEKYFLIQMAGHNRRFIKIIVKIVYFSGKIPNCIFQFFETRPKTSAFFWWVAEILSYLKCKIVSWKRKIQVKSKFFEVFPYQCHSEEITMAFASLW